MTNILRGRDAIRYFRALFGIDGPPVRAINISADVSEATIVTVEFLPKEDIDSDVVETTDDDTPPDTRRFEVIVREIKD